MSPLKSNHLYSSVPEIIILYIYAPYMSRGICVIFKKLF
nr:MAG TPA: hypothetical protein [Caudoviricetes sp.]